VRSRFNWAPEAQRLLSLYRELAPSSA
jgi:hypothetical protein